MAVGSGGEGGWRAAVTTCSHLPLPHPVHTRVRLVPVQHPLLPSHSHQVRRAVAQVEQALDKLNRLQREGRGDRPGGG